MGNRMFSHLDADVAAAHLVSYGGGGAGAQEAVENQIAGVGSNLQNLSEETLGLWS